MLEYAVAPVMWRHVDDGLVIVDPNSGQMRVFNEVGGKIWQQFVDGTPYHQIHAFLMNTYDLDAAQATVDLDQFIAELTQRELLVVKR